MDQLHEKAYRPLPMKKIIWNNFVGGMAWAFGATIGLSIIIAILGLVSKNINFVPIFGSFISQIIDFLLVNNPHFQQ